MEEEGYPGIMPFRELFDELGTHLLDDVRAPPVYHHYDEMDGTVLEAMVERVQAYDALRLVDKESSKRVDVNRDFRATKPMLHEVIVYLIATKQAKRLNEMHYAGNLVRWADPEDALGKLLRRCYTAHMTLITFAFGYYNSEFVADAGDIAESLGIPAPHPVVLTMGMVEGQQYKAFHTYWKDKFGGNILQHLSPVIKKLLLKDDVAEFRRFFKKSVFPDNRWMINGSELVDILLTFEDLSKLGLNKTSWKHPRQLSTLLGPNMTWYFLKLITDTNRQRIISMYRTDLLSFMQCINARNAYMFRAYDIHYRFAIDQVDHVELEEILCNSTQVIPATPATIGAFIHWLGPDNLAANPGLQRVLCTWAANDFALPHLRADPATAVWTFPADLLANNIPSDKDYNSRHLHPNLLRNVSLAELLDSIENCTSVPYFQWYHVITLKDTDEADKLIAAFQRANSITGLPNVLKCLNGNTAHDPIALHIMAHPVFAENAIFLHCLGYLYNRETFIVFDACAERIRLLKNPVFDNLLIPLFFNMDAYGAIERYLRLFPAADTDTERKKIRMDWALRLYEAFNTPTTAAILDLVSGTNPRYPEPIIKDAKRQKKED